MTRVYGVTSYGINKQIFKHLSDQLSDNADYSKKWRLAAASYIALKLHDSLGTIFESSTKIQVSRCLTPPGVTIQAWVLRLM